MLHQSAHIYDVFTKITKIGLFELNLMDESPEVMQQLSHVKCNAAIKSREHLQ